MTDRYRPNNSNNGPPTGPKKSYNNYQGGRNDKHQGDWKSKDFRGNNRNYKSDHYRPGQPASNQSAPNNQSTGGKGYNNGNYHNNSNRNNKGEYYKKDSERGPPPAGPKGSKRPLDRGSYEKQTSSYVPGRNNTYEQNKKPRFPSGPGQGNRFPTGPSNLPKGPKSMEKSKPLPPRHLPRPTKLTKNQIYMIKTNKPEIFERFQQVGEGTYGKVYKAKNSNTGEIVALKKLRLESEKDGFPITSIREIKLLQSFDHPNVVGLLEMMVEQNQIYMIFDYMDHDLTGLLTHPDLKLGENHRKFLFKQLMEGLNYLHLKRVIHRDIKGSNILVDSIGNLKIADFGLARTMKLLKEGEHPDYTNRVITIWYRPPELLLGSTEYGREIDIWGVGCLLIELYTKQATFQGFDEVSQLNKIFNIMGTPNFENWPEISNLPWFEMLKPKDNKVNQFNEFKAKMTDDSFDLAEKLLTLNPRKRLTASQALQHEYFTNEPKPEPLYFLKEVKGEWHEFETKKRRRKERKRLQDEKKRDINDNIAPSAPKPESMAPSTSKINDNESSVSPNQLSISRPQSIRQTEEPEEAQDQQKPDGTV
ncbi:CTD kinase subunit alpha [[Candida] jaroonii]|uniref:CTD kinase subunit alpha n=1 Tax=[Candida] jaroonii TaxID=467808 RepID=A0ACA9Y9H0_9ASCO|nr:CTD kinase subunit alpha [[Candida] jaroonii]